MIIAGITFEEILLLLFVFTLMNVVLLAPVVVAVFRTYLEWRENEVLRQSRR